MKDRRWVNSPAVKPEEIELEDEESSKERRRRVQEFGGDIELHEPRQAGRAKCKRNMREDGEPVRKLEGM